MWQVGRLVYRSVGQRRLSYKHAQITTRNWSLRYNSLSCDASATRTCGCIWYRTTLNNAALHYHRFHGRALTYYTRAAELLCYKPFLSLPRWNSRYRTMRNLSDIYFYCRIIVITLTIVFQDIVTWLYLPPCTWARVWESWRCRIPGRICNM